MNDQQKINALGKALRHLATMAKTSVGTDGPDELLIQAISDAEIILRRTDQAIKPANEQNGD